MGTVGEATQAATRVDAIDGLRAVAALAVFAFHLTWRSPVLYDFAGPVVGHLDLGVEIFFMLSGFLIFGPYAKALARADSLPSTLTYMARRASRIWPAYLIVLTAITVVGTAHLHGVGGFLKHASLTYLYFDDKGGRGLTLAWTLVVEVSFYVFVPLVAFVLARLGRAMVGTTVVLIAVGAVMQRHAAYHETAPWVRILPPRLLMLGVGMLAAAVYHQGDGTGRLGRGLRRGAARPAALLAIAAVCYGALVVFLPASDSIGSLHAERFAKELAQTLMAGCLVIPVLLASDGSGWWGRFLSHHALVYLGTVSYGLYLWHIPMLELWGDQISSDDPRIAVAGWILSLACSLGLASVSWHLIERPVMDGVARRLHARPASVDQPRSRLPDLKE